MSYLILARAFIVLLGMRAGIAYPHGFLQTLPWVLAAMAACWLYDILFLKGD